MYKPCLPVWTTKSDRGDPRPRYGGLFGARERFERVATTEEVKLYLMVDGLSACVYWKPKRKAKNEVKSNRRKSGKR